MRAGLGFIIYVRVSGDAQEKLTIENISVPRFSDSPPISVDARFRDDGTVHEAAAGTIDVRNMFGELVATGTLPVRNVLPGAVRKIVTQVGEGGLWFGRYTVLLHASYGNKGEVLEASALVWIVPWKEYGLWVLVGLGFMAFLVTRRKRLPAFWYVLKNGVPPPEKCAVRVSS